MAVQAGGRSVRRSRGRQGRSAGCYRDSGASRILGSQSRATGHRVSTPTWAASCCLARPCSRASARVACGERSRGEFGPVEIEHFGTRLPFDDPIGDVAVDNLVDSRLDMRVVWVDRVASCARPYRFVLLACQLDPLIADGVSAFALQHDECVDGASSDVGEDVSFVCRDAVETPDIVAGAHRLETPVAETEPDDLVAADHGAGRACRWPDRDPAAKVLGASGAHFVQDMRGVAAGLEHKHVLVPVAKRDDEFLPALVTRGHRDGQPLRCIRTGTLGEGSVLGRLPATRSSSSCVSRGRNSRAAASSSATISSARSQTCGAASGGSWLRRPFRRWRTIARTDEISPAVNRAEGLSRRISSPARYSASVLAPPIGSAVPEDNATPVEVVGGELHADPVAG